MSRTVGKLRRQVREVAGSRQQSPRRDCACSRAAARAAARPDGSSSCPDPAARSSSPCRTAPNRRIERTALDHGDAADAEQGSSGHCFGVAAAGEQQQDQQVSHSDSIRRRVNRWFASRLPAAGAPLWSAAPPDRPSAANAGDHVVDIFDEVDEELRAERAQQLLKRYGGVIIAAAPGSSWAPRPAGRAGAGTRRGRTRRRRSSTSPP